MHHLITLYGKSATISNFYDISYYRHVIDALILQMFNSFWFENLSSKLLCLLLCSRGLWLQLLMRLKRNSSPECTCMEGTEESANCCQLLSVVTWRNYWRELLRREGWNSVRKVRIWHQCNSPDEVVLVFVFVCRGSYRGSHSIHKWGWYSYLPYTFEHTLIYSYLPYTFELTFLLFTLYLWTYIFYLQALSWWEKALTE